MNASRASSPILLMLLERMTHTRAESGAHGTGLPVAVHDPARWRFFEDAFSQADLRLGGGCAGKRDQSDPKARSKQPFGIHQLFDASVSFLLAARRSVQPF